MRRSRQLRPDKERSCDKVFLKTIIDRHKFAQNKILSGGQELTDQERWNINRDDSMLEKSQDKQQSLIDEHKYNSLIAPPKKKSMSSFELDDSQPRWIYNQTSDPVSGSVVKMRQKEYALRHRQQKNFIEVPVEDKSFMVKSIEIELLHAVKALAQAQESQNMQVYDYWIPRLQLLIKTIDVYKLENRIKLPAFIQNIFQKIEEGEPLINELQRQTLSFSRLDLLDVSKSSKTKKTVFVQNSNGTFNRNQKMNSLTEDDEIVITTSVNQEEEPIIHNDTQSDLFQIKIRSQVQDGQLFIGDLAPKEPARYHQKTATSRHVNEVPKMQKLARATAINSIKYFKGVHSQVRQGVKQQRPRTALQNGFKQIRQKRKIGMLEQPQILSMVVGGRTPKADLAFMPAKLDPTLQTGQSEFMATDSSELCKKSGLQRMKSSKSPKKQWHFEAYTSQQNNQFSKQYRNFSSFDKKQRSAHDKKQSFEQQNPDHKYPQTLLSNHKFSFSNSCSSNKQSMRMVQKNKQGETRNPGLIASQHKCHISSPSPLNSKLTLLQEQQSLLRGTDLKSVDTASDPDIKRPKSSNLQQSKMIKRNPFLQEQTTHLPQNPYEIGLKSQVNIEVVHSASSVHSNNSPKSESDLVILQVADLSSEDKHHSKRQYKQVVILPANHQSYAAPPTIDLQSGENTLKLIQQKSAHYSHAIKTDVDTTPISRQSDKTILKLETQEMTSSVEQHSVEQAQRPSHRKPKKVKEYESKQVSLVDWGRGPSSGASRQQYLLNAQQMKYSSSQQRMNNSMDQLRHNNIASSTNLNSTTSFTSSKENFYTTISNGFNQEAKLATLDMANIVDQQLDPPTNIQVLAQGQNNKDRKRLSRGRMQDSNDHKIEQEYLSLSLKGDKQLPATISQEKQSLVPFGRLVNLNQSIGDFEKVASRYGSLNVKTTQASEVDLMAGSTYFENYQTKSSFLEARIEHLNRSSKYRKLLNYNQSMDFNTNEMLSQQFIPKNQLQQPRLKISNKRAVQKQIKQQEAKEEYHSNKMDNSASNYVNGIKYANYNQSQADQVFYQNLQVQTFNSNINTVTDQSPSLQTVKRNSNDQSIRGNTKFTFPVKKLKKSQVQRPLTSLVYKKRRQPSNLINSKNMQGSQDNSILVDDVQVVAKSIKPLSRGSTLINSSQRDLQAQMEQPVNNQLLNDRSDKIQIEHKRLSDGFRQQLRKTKSFSKNSKMLSQLAVEEDSTDTQRQSQGSQRIFSIHGNEQNNYAPAISIHAQSLKIPRHRDSKNQILNSVVNTVEITLPEDQSNSFGVKQQNDTNYLQDRQIEITPAEILEPDYLPRDSNISSFDEFRVEPVNIPINPSQIHMQVKVLALEKKQEMPSQHPKKDLLQLKVLKPKAKEGKSLKSESDYGRQFSVKKKSKSGLDQVKIPEEEEKVIPPPTQFLQDFSIVNMQNFLKMQKLQQLRAQKKKIKLMKMRQSEEKNQQGHISSFGQNSAGVKLSHGQYRQTKSGRQSLQLVANEMMPMIVAVNNDFVKRQLQGKSGVTLNNGELVAYKPTSHPSIYLSYKQHPYTVNNQKTNMTPTRNAHWKSVLKRQQSHQTRPKSSMQQIPNLNSQKNKRSTSGDKNQLGNTLIVQTLQLSKK